MKTTYDRKTQNIIQISEKVQPMIVNEGVKHLNTDQKKSMTTIHHISNKKLILETCDLI